MAFAQSFLRDVQVTSRDPENDDIKHGFWMGLVKRYNKNEYGIWEWVDNWPLAVSNWAAGHPTQDSLVKYHDCAVMDNTGHFKDENCRTKHRPYICKAEFIEYTPSWSNLYEDLGQPINCTDGWQQFGIHCYKAYRYINISFT